MGCRWLLQGKTRSSTRRRPRAGGPGDASTSSATTAISCLTWQASNCVVTRGVDGTAAEEGDGEQSPNKIDGIDALLLALGELLANPEPVPYEPRILVLN